MIDANHVTLQAASDLLQEGDGAIALAAWPEKELLFATYDLSPMITWSSTKALVNPGEYDTKVISSYGLGGIVVAFRNVKP